MLCRLHFNYLPLISPARLIMSLGIILSLSSSTLWAEGKYEHEGFLFRWLVGGGTSTLSYSTPIEGRPSADSDSSSALFAFQLGRAATTNFIVHLNSFYMHTPDREETLSRTDTPNVEYKQKYSSYGFGMGFTYYLPWNVYISPEFRAAVYSHLERIVDLNASGAPAGLRDYTYERADLEGFGYGITLAKEFWASDELGIGAAFFYYKDSLSVRKAEVRSLDGSDTPYDKIPVRNLDTGSADQTYLGMALSITYN